jgi:ABC-type multidrug transport system fused ATPase/permease subunit
VAVLVALYLIEAVSSASQLILTMMVGERAALRLRRRAFAAILSHDVCLLEAGGGGGAQDLCTRVERDVQGVQEAATLRAGMLLQSLIQASRSIEKSRGITLFRPLLLGIITAEKSTALLAAQRASGRNRASRREPH